MEEQFRDIKKLVQEAGTESPSVDFLQNVMGELDVVQLSTSSLYQPLISKKAWAIISILVVALLVSVAFLSEGTSITNTLDLSFLPLTASNNPISGYTLPSTAMYGIIFLAVLCIVQVTIIKRKIDKTFSI